MSKELRVGMMVVAKQSDWFGYTSSMIANQGNPMPIMEIFNTIEGRIALCWHKDKHVSFSYPVEDLTQVDP